MALIWMILMASTIGKILVDNNSTYAIQQVIQIKQPALNKKISYYEPNIVKCFLKIEINQFY